MPPRPSSPRIWYAPRRTPGSSFMAAIMGLGCSPRNKFLTLEHLFDTLVTASIPPPCVKPRRQSKGEMQVQARPVGGKAETLDHAIEAIRVRFGSQALTRVAELPPPLPWPSGTPLDRLTGIGGLPRGRLTLLTGSGTCGKHTLALALLARATHEFAHTVVIDNRMSFDPWPMLAFDPDLRSLTVVRLKSDHAGEAATALAKAGAGFILLMGEIPEPWLGPLEAGANRSGTVLVGIVDAPGRAFAHASSLSLGFSRAD